MRSIVAPLRRLALDPLAATKGNYSDRVLLSRTESHRSATEHKRWEATSRNRRGTRGRTPNACLRVSRGGVMVGVIGR